MRRLEAARLLKEVPAVAEEIKSGSLNLSQIGELSRALKEKERVTGQKISAATKSNLVTFISGKSTSETQCELSRALDIQVKDFEKQRVQQDESVRVELTLSKEQYAKLLKCKDLSAHLVSQQYKDSSWASLIEVLADRYLSSQKLAEPRLSHEQNLGSVSISESLRGDSNSEARKPSTDKSDDDTSSATTALVLPRVNKTLTPKVRRRVLQRDQCCQFIDQHSGRRCGSTYGLQVDHRISKWAGGDHDERFLQVLCFKHNQLKYQKEAQIRFF